MTDMRIVNGLGLQLNAKLPRWSVSLTASPNFLFVLRIMHEILRVFDVFWRRQTSILLRCLLRLEGIRPLEYAPETIHSRVFSAAEYPSNPSIHIIPLSALVCPKFYIAVLSGVREYPILGKGRP